MAKRKEDEYTKTDLKEIKDVFSSDEYFDALYRIFYNGARSKKTIRNAEKYREDILSLVDTLAQEEKSVVSSELSTLILDFQTTSTTTQDSNDLTRKNTVKLEKSLKETIKATEKLAKIFPYNGGKEDMAPQLVSNAGDTEIFNKLTAYKALGKRYLKKGRYNYSQSEARAIEAVLKSSTKEPTLQEIHDNLVNSYQKAISINYVKSADRTSYLKRSGLHGKNFATSALVTTGLFFSGLALALPNAPLQGGSLAAWGIFAAVQAGVLIGSTLIGVGVGATNQATQNRRFEKIRDKQIRPINDKEKFFEIVRNNTPTQEINLKQSIKNFEKQAKEHGFSIDLGKGLTKRANYKILMEAANKELAFGLSKHQVKRLKKVNNLDLETVRNKETIAPIIEKISPAIGVNNPLAKLLDIQGTKRKSKTAKETPTPISDATPVLEAIPTRETTPKETAELEEKEKQTATITPTDKKDISKMLNDERSRIRTFNIEFASIESQISIKIEKGKAKKASHLFKTSTEKIISRIEDTTKDMVERRETTLRSEQFDNISIEYSLNSKKDKKASK